MRKLGLLSLAAHVMLAASAQDQKAFYEEPPRKKVKGISENFPPKKQGQQKFTYSDGFECHALNKKNADKKHEKWKNKQV